MSGAKILVVDDDPNMVSMLRRTLGFEGYVVTTAMDGESALRCAEAERPDVVVLDVMLPGASGLEVCERLRTRGDTSILLLTALGSVPDRVAGLDAGADDYLPKPFAVDELLARVRALLRRATPERVEELRFADLDLVPSTREVRRNGQTVELTAREFDLLEFFLRHPRQVLTREVVFQQVWGYDFLGSSNVIDVHVKALREKLEANGERRLIHTIRGVGYSLRDT
ncbi:MAG: response regulator transcription factor [Chloroflexi bacterium]|nr:response regulator transcription factor [Chloroflexota bacterium]